MTTTTETGGVMVAVPWGAAGCTANTTTPIEGTRSVDALQSNETDTLHGFEPSDLLEYLATDVFAITAALDADDADRPLRGATECEGGDVDAMVSQDRADVTDHSWLIVVAHDHESAGEWRLDLDTIEQDETRLVRFEYRTLRPPLAVAGEQLYRDETCEVAGA